jgi:hypothetical protein
MSSPRIGRISPTVLLSGPENDLRQAQFLPLIFGFAKRDGLRALGPPLLQRRRRQFR